jgi:hypothetical protein
MDESGKAELMITIPHMVSYQQAPAIASSRANLGVETRLTARQFPQRYLGSSR